MSAYGRIGLPVYALAHEDLMALVSNGDAQAFAVVFDRHADAAFSLAHRMCGRQPAAEEVVQEAFLSLWRGGARYDPARGSMRPWVLGVVRSRAIDYFRRETAHAGLDVNDDQATERIPSQADTEGEVERGQDAAQVRRALKELPAAQRQVIELAYFGGFTHSEIAAMLGAPVGTVKGRMRLGLTKLRATLRGPVEASS